MKTQNKNSKGPYLQARNKRWKWMASATAAGVTASQAYGITINLVNNYISAGGGNHLNADLTGDGHPDLTIANAYTFPAAFYDAAVTLNGVRVFGTWHNSGNSIFIWSARVGLGSRSAHYSRVFNRPAGTTHTFGTLPCSLTGSIPIFFKDLHINGGAPIEGFLTVTVGSSFPPYISLDSFTYNTPTPAQASSLTVPDQGSSLGLLAMGAGGIVAFRRWRATQGRP